MTGKTRVPIELAAKTVVLEVHYRANWTDAPDDIELDPLTVASIEDDDLTDKDLLAEALDWVAQSDAAWRAKLQEACWNDLQSQIELARDNLAHDKNERRAG
jgi:hypothetical protein